MVATAWTKAPRSGIFVVSNVVFELSLIPLALLVGNLVSTSLAVILIGFATVFLGLRKFMSHGRHAITAVGIYFLSVAVFGGFALIFLQVIQSSGNTPPHVSPIDSHTVYAALIVYSTSVFIGAIADIRAPAFSPSISEPVHRTPFYFIAPIFVLSGVWFSLAPFHTGPVGDLLAYIGAIIAITLIFERSLLQTPGRMFVLWGVALASIVLYAWQFFEGFGRLNLATLGISVAFLWSRTPSGDRFLPKLLMLIGLPLAMVIGAYVGSSRGYYGVSPSEQPASSTSSDIREFLGTPDLTRGKGLESLISPLSTFGDLLRRDSLQLQSGGNRAYGKTFLDSVIIWIPRSLWADKPVGFNRTLTVELTPELSDLQTGAALAHGEWYYNFGLTGCLAMAPVTAALLLWLDRRLSEVFGPKEYSRTTFLTKVTFIVLAVGIPDYFWGGSFTYANRAGLRAAGLALAILMAILFSRAHRMPKGSGPAANSSSNTTKDALMAIQPGAR